MEESNSSSTSSSTNQNPSNRINKPRIRKPRNPIATSNDDSTMSNQEGSSSSNISIEGGLLKNGSNRGRGNRGRGGEGRGRIRRGNNNGLSGGRGGAMINGGSHRSNGSNTPQLNGSESITGENGSSSMENSSSSASFNNLIPSSINPTSNNDLQSQPISRSNSNNNQLPNRQQPRNNSNNQNKNNNNQNQNQNASSSRRSRFNPALTSGLPLTASAPSFHPPTSHSHSHLAPIIPSPVTETLISRLTKELTNGTYDCSICFSNLTKSTPIDSCEICFTSFHLNCISKWASRSLKESNERLAARNELNQEGGGGTWSCPGCQTRKKEVPKQYYCFCKRLREPPLRLPIMPHSCGLQCGKIRPIGCGHNCGLLCHPGPCPPCSVVLTLPCHCNKVQLPIRCSSIYTSLLSPTTTSSTTSSLQSTSTAELLSCKQSCSKLLSCELHLCKLQCHEGPCSPCEVIRTKKCFCGKDFKEENCGDFGSESRIICYRPGGDLNDMWEGEWSCEKICDAPYDCNKHFCPQSCHPHSTPLSQTCPRSPTILTTCPCTSTSLNLLLASPRKSCLDPIPLCSQRCPKLLECGHTCKLPCHTGNCGPCSNEISIICRCGNFKSTKKCSERFSKDGNLLEVVCEKVCRAMRNCGRHECLEKCCPLAWQEAARSKFKGKKRLLGNELNELESDPLGIHTCQRICGKKLNCGSGHLCSMKDHKGPCAPCLNAGFDELVCHCGSTILLPPIPCGVSIHCLHPCARYTTCGHPPTPHACHEEPDCPPCPFLTEKQCACGKKKIGNVRCSQDAKKVNCGLVCGKLLRCGFHTCKKSCHLPGECEACEQICLKPRRLCNDPCPLNCHAPSPCSIDLPCPMTIEVTCSCGHIKQKAKCAVCESRPEGNRERLVKCTDACVIFKRNAALAEALGIEKKEPKVKEVEYDPIIMSFYANNITWCTAMEASLIEFVRGDKPALHLPIMKHPQRQFTHELAELFDLRSESLDEEPRRSVIVHRQSNSGIPTPTLAEAASKRSTANVLTFTSLRKPIAERTPNNALLLEGVLGYDEEMLRDILRPLLRGLVFGVRWISDVDVLITFEPATTDLETKVNIIQRSLATLVLDTGFCTTVEAVYSGVDGAMKRGNWTPVGNSSRTPLARTAPIYSTNAFAALGDGNPTKPIVRVASNVPVYKPPHLSKSEASAIEDRYTATESIVVPEAEEEKVEEVKENWDEDLTEDPIEEVTL